jgi:hypothetical protein
MGNYGGKILTMLKMLWMRSNGRLFEYGTDFSSSKEAGNFLRS